MNNKTSKIHSICEATKFLFREFYVDRYSVASFQCPLLILLEMFKHTESVVG